MIYAIVVRAYTFIGPNLVSVRRSVRRNHGNSFARLRSRLRHQFLLIPIPSLHKKDTKQGLSFSIFRNVKHCLPT
jgi:hypothetical protein